MAGSIFTQDERLPAPPTRMSVWLEADERRALVNLASRERRRPEEQIAYLLRQKLEELGALPAAVAQAVEQ